MAGKSLIVQFEPNGDQVLYPDQCIPSATGGANPIDNSPVTATSQFGGTKTGGHFGYYNAAFGKGYLYWKLPGNGVHRVWQMDSVAAAKDAVDRIKNALQDLDPGETGYVLVLKDGTTA